VGGRSRVGRSGRFLAPAAVSDRRPATGRSRGGRSGRFLAPAAVSDRTCRAAQHGPGLLGLGRRLLCVGCGGDRTGQARTPASSAGSRRPSVRRAARPGRPGPRSAVRIDSGEDVRHGGSSARPCRRCSRERPVRTGVVGRSSCPHGNRPGLAPTPLAAVEGVTDGRHEPGVVSRHATGILPLRCQRRCLRTRRASRPTTTSARAPPAGLRARRPTARLSPRSQPLLSDASLDRTSLPNKTHESLGRLQADRSEMSGGLPYAEARCRVPPTFSRLRT
jgi:hypothetical protein